MDLTQKLTDLVRRLEAGDPILIERLFEPRHPFWKRSLRNNIRLLGERRWLGQVPILVLFGLWQRGGHEYRKFLDNRETSAYQDWVRGLVSDAQLWAWLEERQLEDRPDEPLELPTELLGWTQFLHDHDYRQRLVLESGMWVEQMQALAQEQRRQVYRAVSAWVDDGQGIRCGRLAEFYPGAAVKCWQEETMHLVVSWVQVCEHQELFPFLIGVYDHMPQQRERFELGKQTGLFGQGTSESAILQSPQPLERWKQYARRAYPDYMVGDEAIWLEMQTEREGNLALSMEEEAILQEQGMPLLINGRAGSGKSLMLYYRFADYCSYYLKTGRYEAPEYRPLFLTYSSGLVRQAQAKVKKILRVSHLHRAERQFSEDEIRECEVFFSTFQEYLLSCLSPERQEHYQPDKYINFYRFRHRYPHRRDVELAWHTIRTLIKGYEVSDYLDPEGYGELPQADRSVDEQIFEQIYRTIWPGYHRLTTHEGYWDDQDLVRDVLANGTLKPIHPVIFCDEVQDFTRVELSVILCSSPWGQFSLDWRVQSLPYAFAGDPLQTINPTGFRWSVLKNHLHEHIRAHRLPNHPFQMPGIQELGNNYRCNPCITRFSNLVNLWRRVLLNDAEIAPQRPWRPHEQGMPVQTFILQENLTPAELRGMLNSSTGTVCILPCSVGEELDYVRRDPQLPAVFAEELRHNRKPEILQTVTAIKGMEFKKILLYKFGEYYQQNFNRSLQHYAQGNLEEISHRLQYFLNQLYVGITRPIEALAIVDTQTGWQQFWDPAVETHFWLDQLGERQQQWQADPPLLNCPVRGMGIPYWTNENLQEVLRSAVEFLKQGAEEGDLQSLRDAQAFAERAGNPELAQECAAWMSQVAGQYVEAGQQFLRLQALAVPNRTPKREAWECFWRGKAWSALQRYRNEFEGIPDLPDYGPLVDLMTLLETTAKCPAATLFQPVVRVRDWLRPEVSPKQWDATWKDGIQGFFKALEQVVNALETVCPQEAERGAFLEATREALDNSLAFLGQRRPFAAQHSMILGICHFHQQRFAEAIAIWQQGDNKEHALYYRAKAQLEPLPGKVEWLSKDRQDREVVRLWQESGFPLQGEWQEYAKVIVTSLERLKHWPLLLRVLIQLHNWEKLWQTAQAHPQAWQRGHDYELVATLARDSTIGTDWEALERQSPGLRAFVREVLATLEAEHAWLSQRRTLELGLAYERLGHYQDTLKFYSHFTEAKEISARGRSKIRQRWLATHKRYQDFLQSQGRPTEGLAEQLKERQERWGEQIPQAEPELPSWDPWQFPLVELPSPVQGWILQQGRTDGDNPSRPGKQQRLKAEILQALDRLSEEQLQQICTQVQRFIH
ncbi:MAG: hypothetical protein Q6L60_02115 [Thermostichus sp. HHBFW_bins_43]